jgi:hypothetical protein
MIRTGRTPGPVAPPPVIRSLRGGAPAFGTPTPRLRTKLPLRRSALVVHHARRGQGHHDLRVHPATSAVGGRIHRGRYDRESA